MKKISILDILEGFFHPELPGPRNAHSFSKMKPKGPANFPYESEDEEGYSEKEIDQELKLELKLGNVMRDPRNLPGHNVHNGSFSKGKGSKSFGNYQTTGKQFPEKSQMDVRVGPIEEDLGSMHDPESEELERKKIGQEIVDASSTTPPEVDEAVAKALATRDRARKEAVAARKTKTIPSEKWESAKSLVPIEEDVGMREKGRAYGSQVTTKQPFASGVPKATGSDFMDEDEIAHELGLMEWISSSPILTRRASGPESEYDFFDKDRPAFTMTTEEEFNETQRKLTKNAKKKKRT